MKKLLQKDKRKRKLVCMLESDRYYGKSISKNLNYSKLVRWNGVLKLSTHTIFTQLTNRCILTESKTRVNRLYNYSRSVLLKLARSGSLNGVKKSAW